MSNERSDGIVLRLRRRPRSDRTHRVEGAPLQRVFRHREVRTGPNALACLEMRVLVVAGDAERRRELSGRVEFAGQEARGGSDAVHVMEAVRRERPHALLVDADASAGALESLLSRARAAAEAPLPAVLVLPEGSVWLRATLPPPLHPARAVADADPEGAALASALTEIAAAGQLPPPPVQQVGPMRIDRARSSVAGPNGEAELTASELALLDAIVAGSGEVVRAETVAEALWGRAVVDPHARGAIRAHVHTLRRKLAGAGLEGVIETLPRVGYRLGSLRADD